MAYVPLRTFEVERTKGLSPSHPKYWEGKAAAARDYAHKLETSYAYEQREKDANRSMAEHSRGLAKEHEAMAATVAKLPPGAWHPGVAREMTEGQRNRDIKDKTVFEPRGSKGSKQYVAQVHAETAGGKHGIFSSVPLKTEAAAQRLAVSLGGPYSQGRPTAIRTVYKPSALAVVPSQRYDVEGQQKFMDRGPAAAGKAMKQASLFATGPVGQQKKKPEAHGPVQQGAKGGQFYVTSSGEKVYVK